MHEIIWVQGHASKILAGRRCAESFAAEHIL